MTVLGNVTHKWHNLLRVTHALGFYVYLSSFTLSKAHLFYPECSASAVYGLDKEVSDHSYVLHCIFSLNFLIWVVLGCTWRTWLHQCSLCILYICVCVCVCELWMYKAVLEMCKHPHRYTGHSALCFEHLLMLKKKKKFFFKMVILCIFYLFIHFHNCWIELTYML